MRHEFPYPDFGAIEVPDESILGIYGIPRLARPLSDDEAISEGLDNPIGMERLARAVKPGARVLMIVDDISRPTPAHRIVPAVLRELKAAGVRDDHVKFLIALGTHRKMTREEMARKLGEEVLTRYEVINHQWDNPDALEYFGRTSNGIQVHVNKEVMRADFSIGIGSILPHPAAGFSGGGKIIAPGVGSEATVGEFHWQSISYPVGEVLGKRDNPMREMIDAVAAKAKLSAIVNCICDGDGKIIKVVAGHPVKAHRVGCRYSLSIFGVTIKDAHNADIVVTDSHPMDMDMWQAVKAMCVLDAFVPGGCITILVTPSPEGVSPTHPELGRYGYMLKGEAEKLIKSGKVGLTCAHNMVQGGRLVKRSRAMIVSRGITDRQARTLGFTRFDTAQEALEEALRIKGRRAKVIILKHGADIIPLVHPVQRRVPSGSAAPRKAVRRGRR